MEQVDNINTPNESEQPVVDSTINDDMEIEVSIFKDENWNPVTEKVKLSELKNWYLKWADYTRKMQDLAEQRKQIEKAQDEATTPDELQAVETLRKKYWFVTRDELEAQAKKMADEQKLSQVIDSNPDLKQFEWAIREIGKSSNMAYEDIIVKYGFASKDKLEKARASRWDVKGYLDKGQKQKSIKEMTTEEYLAWKKANMWTGDGKWNKAST